MDRLNKKLTRHVAVIESCYRARADVSRFREKIAKLANRYHLQLIYAFGSRAKEAHNLVHGKKVGRPASSSDLDIGLKPERPLSVEEKVKIGVLLEDLFQVPRVDVVTLPDAPVTATNSPLLTEMSTPLRTSMRAAPSL